MENNEYKRDYKRLIKEVGEDKANELMSQTDKKEFLKPGEVPPGWNEKKDINGFEYMKQLAEKQSSIAAEYEETVKKINKSSKKYIESFLEGTQSINLFSFIGDLEKYLKLEGLIRGQFNQPDIEVSFGEEPILKIKITYLTFFNLDLEIEKQENFEFNPVTLSFNIRINNKELETK